MRKNRQYAVILGTLYLVAALAIVLTSLAFFFNYESTLMENLYRSDVNDLERERENTHSMLEIGNALASQVYTDWNIAYLLFATERDVYQERAAFMQMNKYRLSIPAVESIYVYNGRLDEFHCSADTYGNFYVPSAEFCDGRMADILREELPQRTSPFARKAVIRLARGTVELPLYTFVYTERYGTLGRSVVAVNFSQSWIRQLSEPAGRAQVQTLIVDSAGVVVSNSSRFPMTTNVSKQDFFGAASAKENGYHVMDWGGQQTLLTFLAEDSYGWRYIRLTPMEQIRQASLPLRNYLFYTDAVLGLVLLALAWLASKRLYAPIGRTNERLTSLEAERKRALAAERENALRRLLTGATPTGGRTLAEEGEPPFGESALRLVCLYVTDLHGFRERLVGKQRGQALRDVARRGSEALEAFGRVAHALLEDESGVALALEGHTDEAVLAQRMEEAVAACGRETGVHLYAIISGEGRGAASLGALYAQVRQASCHRLFAPHESVLLSERVLERRRHNYVYPVKKEAMLEDALLVGQADAAKALARAILESTRDYSYSVINLVASRLTMSITNLAVGSETADDSAESLVYQVGDLALADAQSVEEIAAYLNRAIDLTIGFFAQRRSGRYDEMVGKINALIRDNYGDNALCLDSVARHFELSSAYLGKLYRSATGKSVVAMIGETRLANAKRMLVETPDMSITEISERTGFTSISYFSKVFRRENGISPNEYRAQKLREQIR